MNILEQYCKIFDENNYKHKSGYIYKNHINCDDINRELIWVCRYGYIDAVEFLIKNGADGTYQNYNAMKHAIYYQHVEIVNILIKNGIDITANILNEYIQKNKNIEIAKIYEEENNKFIIV